MFETVTKKIKVNPFAHFLLCTEYLMTFRFKTLRNILLKNKFSAVQILLQSRPLVPGANVDLKDEEIMLLTRNFLIWL